MENTKIIIDLDAMPKAAQDRLARATLEAVKRFKSQPGGKEYLARRAEEFHKREAAAKEGS